MTVVWSRARDLEAQRGWEQRKGRVGRKKNSEKNRTTRGQFAACFFPACGKWSLCRSTHCHLLNSH